MSISSSTVSGRRKFSLPRLLLTLVVIATTAGAAYLYGVRSIAPPGEQEALKIYGMDMPTKNGLDARFTDADRDLLADAPKDESRWIDPPVLTFSYLVTEQDRYKQAWDGLIRHLAKRTGKQVEYLAFDSAEEQFRALSDGRLHIAGLNTGAVPIAVNACGFVPVCSFGKDGQIVSYTMRIIARHDSPVDSVEDLAGRTLTLTNPTSNSGWKAPLTLLKREFQLLPVRDFSVIYSNGHAESLQGVAAGEYEVAAVASDEMDLAVERGLISKDEIKSIFESEPFPNNVLGYVYNLRPELAEKLKQAIFDFPWSGSDLEREFSALGAQQFVPVSYRDDMKLIRSIDDAMGRRHVVNVDPLEAERQTPGPSTRH